LKSRLVRWRLNSKCEGLHQWHALSVTVPSNPSWTTSFTSRAVFTPDGRGCLLSMDRERERRGRNPATGEDLILAPRKVVTFKCSGKLRERVNGRS